MKLLQLIEHLEDLLTKYGDVEVDILTESSYSHEELIALMVTFDEQIAQKQGSGIQVEQPLGDIAYSPGDKRVKLLPEGF